MLDWLVYASLGKLIIHLWMKFYLPDWLSKFEFLTKLHECGLCSGVWIFIFLAFCMNIDIINLWFYVNVFIVGKVITGMLTSWLVHVFSIGFSELYLTVVVE